MEGQRLARQSNAMHEKAQPRVDFRQLVSGSVSINGAKFSALVRDGASTEEIIEKVARQHGGGAAKIYNQELKAYEIVAVKLGEHLLVKGDPDKVSKADFSQFKDPQSMKEAAIRASKESKGGLHFFLGENGIPVALGKDGGLVFPNAEELRLRGNTSTIHISLVDYDANPVTLDDLDNMYSKTGGIRMSSEAQQQMARPFYIGMDEIKQAHGGMRGEKLLLADTSVLVLNKDTGDMMTMAEHAIGPEGFKRQEFDFFQIAPIMTNQPAQKQFNFVDARALQNTDLGPMQIPMDGSAVKIPYLFIKVFDGKVEDAVSIGTALEDLKKPKEQKLQRQPQLPAVMIRNNTKEPKRKDFVQTEPEFTLRPVKKRKTHPENSWMPLAEKPTVGIPIARRPSPAPLKMSKAPKQYRRSKVKPLCLKKTKKKTKKPEIKKRNRKPKRLKPKPSAKKKTPKTIPKTNPIKEKRKRKPKKQIKVVQPLTSTIIKEKKNPKKKPKAKKPPKPSALKREKTRKKKDKIRKAKSLSRKKKMKSYFFKEMVGLYKKAKRNAVRNSR